MELEVFGRIVRRWWLALAAALLAGSVIGFSFAETRTPVYQAGVDLLIGPLSADSNVLRAAGQTAQTYAELASAESTIDAVEAELRDPRAGSASVIATASEVTRILKVRVRAADAVLVADVADAIAAELVRVGGEEIAAAQLAGGGEDPNVYRVGEVRLLEGATAPTTPISPNKQLITALGGLSMLLVAAVAIVFYEYSRDAVRVIGDLDRILPGTAVSRIERSWEPRQHHGDQIAVLRSEHDPTATSLRGLSIDVASQILPSTPNCALSVAGVVEGDRSSDVAVNIAAALALTGRRVALVDGNEVANEVRTRLWGACEHPVEPLAVRVDKSAEIVLDGRYSEIGSGVLDLYSSEWSRLPEREHLEAALADLGAGYDYVVIHTAPAFGSPAAVRWASAAAGSLLVVTTEVASARTVEHCGATLSRGARNFIGTVFDERPRSSRGSSFARRFFGGSGKIEPQPPRPAARATASTLEPVMESAGPS